MTQFKVVLACYACKMKVESELLSLGYKHFHFDMDHELLIFKYNVNPKAIVRILDNIGYKAEHYEPIDM